MGATNRSDHSGRFLEEHPEEAENDLAAVIKTPKRSRFETRSANQEEHRTVRARQEVLMAFIYFRQSTLARCSHCRLTTAIPVNTQLVPMKAPKGQLLR